MADITLGFPEFFLFPWLKAFISPPFFLLTRARFSCLLGSREDAPSFLSHVSWQRPLQTTSSLKSHRLTSRCFTAVSNRWGQPVLCSEPHRLFHLPESETSHPAPSTPRLPSEPFLSLPSAIFIAYPQLFPGGGVQNPPANAGDSRNTGSLPGSGR